jgi:hypothetical protein
MELMRDKRAERGPLGHKSLVDSSSPSGPGTMEDRYGRSSAPQRELPSSSEHPKVSVLPLKRSWEILFCATQRQRRAPPRTQFIRERDRALARRPSPFRQPAEPSFPRPRSMAVLDSALPTNHIHPCI